MKTSNDMKTYKKVVHEKYKAQIKDAVNDIGIPIDLDDSRWDMYADIYKKEIENSEIIFNEKIRIMKEKILPAFAKDANQKEIFMHICEQLYYFNFEFVICVGNQKQKKTFHNFGISDESLIFIMEDYENPEELKSGNEMLQILTNRKTCNCKKVEFFDENNNRFRIKNISNENPYILELELEKI